MRFFLFAAFVAASLSAASAHDYRAGDLVIEHPWTRTTPAAAPVAGGYLVVVNKGSAADRLVSAGFERSKTVEIHEMKQEGGVMRMRALPAGLPIPAGGRVELAPGGLHLMFMGLEGRLNEGERIKGELVFEKAGRVAVEFKVESLGYGSKGKAEGHGGHGGHKH